MLSLYSFKLKNPRKGTETLHFATAGQRQGSFKLKNPRKGTETSELSEKLNIALTDFQIKESPEGDWNASEPALQGLSHNFQIKESPEGDWNLLRLVCLSGAPALSN